MRFLVDAQLPMRLCEWLEAQGHETAYVPTLLSGEAPDRDIAAYAERHGWVLVTKDDDFITRHPPIGYQLVWLRIGNATNRALLGWLWPLMPAIVGELERGERLVEVR